MPQRLMGFTSAADRQRLEAFIIVVASFHPTYQPSQISAFLLMRNCFLPLSTAFQSYKLQERKHNYLLPLRTGRLSDHKFIRRMLYLDVY